MRSLFQTLFAIAVVASQSSLAQSENDAAEPSVEGPRSIDLLVNDPLDSWDLPSDLWTIENGVVIGNTGSEKIRIPEWAYTKQAFSDFVFTCELRLSGDERRNTGIYYRVNKIQYMNKQGAKSFEAPSGYEFDAAYHIPGKRNNRGTLGDWYARPKLRIYPDPNLINQAYKTDQWNRMTLRARGNRLEYWINGIKIMDYRDSDPNGSRSGVIGFQIHNGSVMKVEYRNIRVLPLE
ncbi:MAG: DUF1080 domain-containing protein [Verrucomicrobiota bacterium]